MSNTEPSSSAASDPQTRAPLERRVALSIRGLSKTFGQTRALIDVDLDLFAGEVHALVGQNGSGKSTLIKILSGYHAPDEGTVSIDGIPARLPMTNRDVEAAGLRFVHQNPGLCPLFTVAETICLRSWDLTWYGRIRWEYERARVKEILRDVELDVGPDTLVRDLTPSQRAVVAVLRSIQGIGDGRAILVLDEPTASLNKSDADRLFRTIRRLTASGHAVLFVSHRLDEVLAIADRISVIRDGRLVLSTDPSRTSEQALIGAILGRELGALYPGRPSDPRVGVLRVENLTGSTVDHFSCAVREGEILGITGLGGMGQDELPYLIYGSTRAQAGDVYVDDDRVGPIGPRPSLAAGMVLLPADRERLSGVRRATVAENVTMGTIDRFFEHGWLRKGKEVSEVHRLLVEFQVRPSDPLMKLGALSGGNQQKTLLAKWLQSRPRVLLLHEPTQGVDVGSRQQVFRMIRDVAEQGTAVVIASAEYADLANICTRVLVMRRGSVQTELTADLLSEDRLIQACYASA
jgi:ribose transport system ATP-binding protein